MNLTPTPCLPFRRHALALAFALACPALPAATLNVSGACTLFSAIANANTDSDNDGANIGCPAGSGADTLNLTGNATYTLDNLLPHVTSTITINGNRATIDSKPQYSSAFYVSNTGKLTINKLTIKNASAQKGAGIFNQGLLQLNDSTITGNSVYPVCDYYCFGSYGGGIFNSGTATLTNSTVSHNTADAGYSINGDSGRGGGIYNNGVMTLNNSKVTNNKATGSHYRGEGLLGGGIINFGTMTLTDSTISGNSADDQGGGIRNRGTMTLTNSTVSHNTSPLAGGGIYSGHFLPSGNKLTLINSTVANNKAAGGAGIFNAQSLSLTNSTVSGNQAANSGGGIVNNGDLSLTHSTLANNRSATAKGGGIFNLRNLTLTNTLIANSQSGGDCANKNAGITTVQGINLLEDGSCGADMMGDPKLAPLLDNGGETATHALQANSPARDTANKPLCAAQDQRGVSRPQPTGGGCDIGAFERLTSIPDTVISVVHFFDDNLLNGGLSGTGKGRQHSTALRNQLLVAGHYKAQNLPDAACSQLNRTLKHIDTDKQPDANDYVTGNQGTALVGKINGLATTWSCPS